MNNDQSFLSAPDEADLPSTLPSYLPLGRTVDTDKGQEVSSDCFAKEKKTSTSECDHNEKITSSSPESSASKVKDTVKIKPKPCANKISAALFAAGTGGLAFDPQLLAKVSGIDLALVGSEEIQQIMKCPDLLSIYQKLQEEDDRRQRRLQRNRTSARMRREKKKTMVEMFEVEVNKLEGSHNMLNSHSFGSGKAALLLNALEYCGEEHVRHAMMTKEAKSERLNRVLTQHYKCSKSICRANLDTLLLAASWNTSLTEDLKFELGLSDQQTEMLHAMSHEIQQEAFQLELIKKCFTALRAHDWLQFSGIENFLTQSKSIFTANQFQKLLQFTYENQQVIEQLQVVPSSQGETTVQQEADLTFRFDGDLP